jgi:Bifunctional DNA primase/polymerase, N-terminal
MSHNCGVALDLASAGFHVFPCRSDNKRPSIREWRDNSSTDLQQIEAWWRVRASHLVGIDLHKAGLLVVDGDRHPDEDGVIHHDGVDSLRELFRGHGTSAARYPITRTPSGGIHIYCKSPPGFGNRRGDLPEGIDVRGSGGYVIAPGCVLPDGREYAPAEGRPDLISAFRADAIPSPPEWLAAMIKRADRPPGPAPVISLQRGRRFECYAASALDRMARELSAKRPETGRNEALNLIAWKMATMIARGWIGQAEVERVLHQAAVACNLVKDDGARSVRATIASGLNAGISHPHPDLRDRNYETKVA